MHTHKETERASWQVQSMQKARSVTGQAEGMAGCNELFVFFYVSFQPRAGVWVWINCSNLESFQTDKNTWTDLYVQAFLSEDNVELLRK